MESTQGETMAFIGERLGDYRILAQIGQGGMGTVYQAEDTQLGRKVAIKILKPALLADGSQGLLRFQSEARIQANLNHANVVTLLDFEPFGDSYCMIMEYVEGKTLTELIRTIGPLPSHIVVMISRQILDGLSAAHRQGVIHRDLKPSNVMLTAEGVVKVMDFGIAKVEGAENLTSAGAPVGTVSYMSPEQLQGEPVDVRSDLYSFGIILFELLTGCTPFKNDSDISSIIHHIHTPPPRPSQVRPDIPPELEEIVLHCLNKLPDQRYQSAGEVLAALDFYEDRERSQGRSELFGRRMLAQWLAAHIQRQASAAAALPGRPSSRTAPLFDTPPSAPRTTPPAQSVAAQRARGKIIPALTVLVLMVLAGGTVYLYYAKPWAAGHKDTEGQGELTTSGTQVAVPPRADSTDVGPTAVATTPPEQAATGARSGTPSATATSTPPSAERAKDVAGFDANAARTIVPPPPGRKMAASEGAAATGSARKVVPGSAAPPGSQTASDANSEGGFLILLDPDPSGEKLSAAEAQARVADLLREAGHKVVPAGAPGSAVREALARHDHAAMRRNGVSYALVGTARGILEPQTAYGTTYYAGQVSVTFELVSMTNGKAVASASSSAKSRGSTNADTALNDALLTATSDAVRDLLRKF
jgi:serine/threonine protein kinase